MADRLNTVSASGNTALDQCLDGNVITSVQKSPSSCMYRMDQWTMSSMSGPTSHPVFNVVWLKVLLQYLSVIGPKFTVADHHC